MPDENTPETEPETEPEEKTLLEKMKDALRRTDDDINDSLQADIDAAIADMQRVGVSADADTTEPLVIKCIELFCKASFDYMAQGERYMTNYRRLRDSLSLSETYKGGAENG